MKQPQSSTNPQHNHWTPWERGCLLAATFSLGLGLAWLSWIKASPIGSMLFMNYGLSHLEATRVERINGYWLFALLPLLFVERLRLMAAGAMALYFSVVIYARADQGGNPFTDYALLASAIRLATPLAFIMVFSAWWQSRSAQLAQTFPLHLIALATAVTFGMHGVEAMLAHPVFIDMTLGVAQQLSFGPVALSETQARYLLLAVGVIDIVAALGVLFFRNRVALCWVVAWGLFTAALRFLNYGDGGLPDAIIRLPHGILPLVLWRFCSWGRLFTRTFEPRSG
jgi:hypothetical protein